ncbi:MAG TPA: hypothetical protein VNS32_11890 [Flavisolibacter sp.]|nr:hypothetical protein [Flavisolibacter sp.]
MHGEENIIRLHLEFKQLRTYKEKVEFFDQQFGCLSNTYPEFDPELKFLFEQKEFDAFTEIFEKERRKAIILDRRYEIDGKTYIFNATPVNSNTVILNDYILYHFINNDKKFESHVNAIRNKAEINEQQIWEAWLNALNRIDSIENKLAGGEERGLRYRFMNVFINGYRDKEQGLLKKFFNRKKFIELYLYAQGVLFRQYFQQLNDLCDFSTSAVHDERLQQKTSEMRILKEYIRKYFFH